MFNQEGVDECGMSHHTFQRKNQEKINNPEYISYDNRRKSYKNWPKTFSAYQIQNLSDAGFFYTGRSDKIECFWCGVRLCNWNDNESPVEQHIIWSPKCSFLKMTKGIEYIEEMREKFVVKVEELHA